MKTLFSVLLATVSQLSSPGHLFVHMTGGYDVLVDGASMGLTDNNVGGKIVDCAPGRHHVVVRSSDGREGAFDVQIASGQTNDITLSPLGLRKKLASADDPGALHVVCVPEDCSVMFRDKDKMTSDDTVDAVPAGHYPVVASRGALTLRTSVDVPAGTVVTLECNFNTRATRVTDAHRRARHLTVAEANDGLAHLNVPTYWKTAIRSSLPAGVIVVQAQEVANNGIRASLRVPTEDVGMALIESLLQSNQFSKVGVTTYPRKEINGWTVDFVFYFPGGH